MSHTLCHGLYCFTINQGKAARRVGKAVRKANRTFVRGEAAVQWGRKEAHCTALHCSVSFISRREGLLVSLLHFI